MYPVIPIIDGFLRSFWKPIVFTGLVLLAYYLGFKKASDICTSRAASESAAIASHVVEVTEEVAKVKEEINTARSNNQDDKRDSCLLSSDPFSSHCL